jgi:hypothetical protein
MKALTIFSSTLALSALALMAVPQAQAAGRGAGNSPPSQAQGGGNGGGSSQGNGGNGGSSQGRGNGGGSSQGGGNGGGSSQSQGNGGNGGSSQGNGGNGGSSQGSGGGSANLTCAAGSVTSNPLAGGSSLSYSSCLNPVEGNDVTSTISAPLTAFLNDTLGEGWVFDGKYENGSNSSGPNNLGFSWVQNGNGSGTWAVNQTVNSPFVISLKAGNRYTSYYFDGSSSTLGGTWATFDQKDLSHASLFVGRPTTPPNTQVPEPAAAAALVLFGLTAMGASKKQRSADN